MFKPADPSKRRPAYLQSHTKENAIWQLKLLPLALALVMAHGWWEDNQDEIKRKLKNKIDQNKKS